MFVRQCCWAWNSPARYSLSIPGVFLLGAVEAVEGIGPGALENRAGDVNLSEIDGPKNRSPETGAVVGCDLETGAGEIGEVEVRSRFVGTKIPIRSFCQGLTSGMALKIGAAEEGTAHESRLHVLRI